LSWAAKQAEVGAQAIHKLTENRLAPWGGRPVGVIFHFFHLLSSLAVVENITLHMDLCQVCPGSERREKSLAPSRTGRGTLPGRRTPQRTAWRATAAGGHHVTLSIDDEESSWFVVAPYLSVKDVSAVDFFVPIGALEAETGNRGRGMGVKTLTEHDDAGSRRG
jgi:hypothetical protein